MPKETPVIDEVVEEEPVTTAGMFSDFDPKILLYGAGTFLACYLILKSI